MKKNVVGWFEIPTHNMDRAIKFYETVFGYSLQKVDFNETYMAWFPFADQAPGAAGALVYEPECYTPCANGTLIYFSSPSDNLQAELDRVEAAGGKVLSHKTLISDEIGFMAMCMDSEGNQIALHSMK